MTKLVGRCRAVRIVARLVGIVLELKEVNVLAKEHMQEAFLKLNPMHTIPTLQDDTFVLWESRAIMRYLVDMYAPDHSLYPKDVRMRALINQFLDYDLGTFYRTVADYFYSYLLKGEEKCPKKEAAFQTSLRSLETLLESNPRRFLIGEKMTLADVSLMESLTVPEVRLENGCHHDVDRRLLSYVAILNSVRNKPCRAYWCTITGVRNCTRKCSTARHNLITLTRT
ncbi:glutathione S-transferase 1-1-like isoform X2 [Amblyomma americanum]